MNIGCGETEIRPSLSEDPLLKQRRQDILAQLCIGLVGIDRPQEAQRLQHIFQDPMSTIDQRGFALDQLRDHVIELSSYGATQIPTLGNVLGKAYDLADIPDQSMVPERIHTYVEGFQPAHVGRRVPARVA